MNEEEEDKDKDKVKVNEEAVDRIRKDMIRNPDEFGFQKIFAHNSCILQVKNIL